MNTMEEVSYDYSPLDYCGFSSFSDGSKFRYSNGDICLATDSSTWAKRLINNVPIQDYIDSKALVPPESLFFPEFGTLEKKKKKKEAVGNYIEDCEFCGEYMEKTYRFYGKLVCKICIPLLEKEKCLTCSNINKYAELFTNDVEDSPFCQRYIKDEADKEANYCNDCSFKIKMVYQDDKLLGSSYHSYLLSGAGSCEDDEEEYYERMYQGMIEKHCRICGDESEMDSICRNCISWVFN